MHEAEPLLYWRVRRDGVWKFERAKYIRLIDWEFSAEQPTRQVTPHEYIVQPPEVNESEN